MLQVGTSELFHEFRRQRPSWRSWLGGKVVPVCGNPIRPNLGLSSSDRATLLSEVELIINAHDVCVVSNDAALFRPNVQAVDHLIDFANESARVRAFVHLSSA